MQSSCCFPANPLHKCFEQCTDYQSTTQRIILIHQQLCKIVLTTDHWHQLSTICPGPDKAISPLKFKDFYRGSRDLDLLLADVAGLDRFQSIMSFNFSALTLSSGSFLGLGFISPDLFLHLIFRIYLTANSLSSLSGVQIIVCRVDSLGLFQADLIKVGWMTS